MRISLISALVFVTLAAALSVAGKARAARVDNLHSATVLVADTSEEVRAEALGKALATVLVRVTGSREAPDDQALQPLIENAAAYVQVYRYASGPDGQSLSVTFDGQAVQRAVASAGVPVWGRERPSVMIWLAIDYGSGQRVLLSSDNEGAVANAVREAAEDRGLPINFPLMDAEDRENISFADVWGGFSQTVESASGRYQPDAILVGRARRRPGRRLGVEWKLYYASSVIASEGSITQGIEEAADYFARQFVVGGSAGASRAVALEVSDIRSVAVFARVLKHLESLSVVESLQIVTVRDDVITFELGLKGSSDQLRRAISLADILQESPSESPDPLSQVLYFRPQP